MKFLNMMLTTYKPSVSDKITHSDFKEGDQSKVLKNQSLIGIAFTRDSTCWKFFIEIKYN